MACWNFYAGDKLARRFVKIDKMTTAMDTDDSKPLFCHSGYGVFN